MNARVTGAAGVAAAFVSLVVAATALPARSSVLPASAKSLGPAPAAVHGVAEAGHVRSGEPVPACAAVGRVTWYTVDAPHRGSMLARLVARDQLDAAIVVYRVVRSQ